MLAKKDIKVFYNKAPVIMQGIFFPLIFIFIYNTGKAIDPIVFTAGVTALTLFFNITAIGPITIPWETGTGTLERLYTYPIDIKTILLSNLLSSLIFGIGLTLIPMTIVIIIFSQSIMINFWIVIGGTILGALMYACFGILLSIPPSQTLQDSMILITIVKFIIMFLSPFFGPIDNIIFNFSPSTYVIDLLRYGLGGTSIFGEYVIWDVIILLILTSIFILIGVKSHQKTLEKRFR